MKVDFLQTADEEFVLILIVAVQNLHRHPDSWKSRLKPGEM